MAIHETKLGRDDLLNFLLATTKAFVNAILKKDHEASALYGRCMMETMNVSQRVCA